LRDRQERGQRLRSVRSFRSFGWEPHPDTVLLQYWLRGEGDDSGPELRSFWHWLLLRQHQKSHPADEPLRNEDLPARRLGVRSPLRHPGHAVAAVDPDVQVLGPAQKRTLPGILGGPGPLLRGSSIGTATVLGIRLQVVL